METSLIVNSLPSLQNDFLSALQEPLTGDERLAAGLAEGAGKSSARFESIADKLLCSTESLGATERLMLYQRQYWYRLLDSLCEDFPNVDSLLGRERLLAAFESYLTAYPPDHWSLRMLGKNFARHLAKDLSLSEAHRNMGAALAEFDYAHMEVFDAPALPEPSNQDLQTGKLRLQPAIRLIFTDQAISRHLRIAEHTPVTDSKAPELHVVWRDRRTHLRAIKEHGELLPLLRAIERGGTLIEILNDTTPLPSPERLHDAFKRWRSAGWLALAHPNPF